MRFASLKLVACAVALVADVSSARPQDDPYAAHVARSKPRSPEEERKGFHVPPGFEVQLVAAEPDVRKPINMNFDDRGRLWVSQSVEYPFPARQNARTRDTVAILEDVDGDGKADRVTTFADNLNIPIGVLPVRGGALVYSIPYIYRIDGDGRADRRRVLYGSYGFRDTHGMTGEFTWGFDGWVYACHGFSNASVVRGADGHAVRMESGNTYRFRPDGSRVEAWTHGQVNPFGLTLDPLGNLYSCDCHSRPIYQLLRGAYYPSFGKPHDGLGFGPEMMTHDHGSTAIAGITYYAADHFPPAYRDTIFVGNVVTNRINHDRLERHGSTYLAIQEPDFLISDDPWFRPVDIKLGPDGALYVADFYNRIIGHYEVPLTHPGRDHERGRIWRIVYRGPRGDGNPRAPRRDWNRASTAELVADLAHPNLVVRVKAMNQLAERPDPGAASAVRGVMHSGSSPFQRVHGLWVLERRGVLDEETVTAAAHDAAAPVRVQAMRILAGRAALRPGLRSVARAALMDPDAFVRRAAADSLGTHPDLGNVEPLLRLRHRVPRDDTHLLHVVRMALRDQLAGVPGWYQNVARRLSEVDARALADVAPGVHTPEAARYLLDHLERYAEPYADQLRYVYHVARYGGRAMARELLGAVRGDCGASLRHQVALFKAVKEGTEARGDSLEPAAREWGESLTRRLLASPDDEDVLAGIELGGALRMASLPDYFAGVATDRRAAEANRVAALVALAGLNPRRCLPLLGQVLSDATEPLPLRLSAAHLLADTNSSAARAELLKQLPTAPERLARSLAAGLASTPGGADELIRLIEKGKASAKLLQDRGVEDRLLRSQGPGARGRIERLTRALPPPDRRFQELIQTRRAGFARAVKDPRLGARVFEKNCAVCHELANHGAKVGPQLDGVGIRGLDRLLEDVIDPSRNVDQAFRLTTLYLNTGRIVSGLLLREEGQVLVLANSQGKEVRVPNSSVEERTVSQLSPMPATLAEQMPEADFYNLIAFLLTQRPPQGSKVPAALGN